MIRILEIRACTQCPYFSNNCEGNDFGICTNPHHRLYIGRTIKHEDMLFDFPRWCPLEVKD